jgi:hypothetical protein
VDKFQKSSFQLLIVDENTDILVLKMFFLCIKFKPESEVVLQDYICRNFETDCLWQCLHCGSNQTVLHLKICLQ